MIQGGLVEARTGPSCQAPGDPCMMGAARWLRLRRTSLGPRGFTTTLGRRSDQSRRTKRESQGAGDPCASVNPLPIGARCGREPTLIFPGMDQPDCSGSKIRGAKIKSSIFRGCGPLDAVLGHNNFTLTKAVCDVFSRSTLELQAALPGGFDRRAHDQREKSQVQVFLIFLSKSVP